MIIQLYVSKQKTHPSHLESPIRKYMHIKLKCLYAYFAIVCYIILKSDWIISQLHTFMHVCVRGWYCAYVMSVRVNNFLLIINHFMSNHALDLKLMRAFAKRNSKVTKTRKQIKEKETEKVERESRKQAKISIDFRKRKRSSGRTDIDLVWLVCLFFLFVWV